MKTVKIMIEIKVSDKAKYAAIDSNGTPYGYSDKPERGTCIWDEDTQVLICEKCEIINWRETLTEVK